MRKKEKESEKTDSVTDYILLQAEAAATVRATTGKQKLILPGITSWRQLYQSYSNWCLTNQRAVASEGFFDRIRKKVFGTDISCEAKTTLPVCKICTKCTTALANGVASGEIERAIQVLLKTHKQLAHDEWRWHHQFLKMVTKPASPYLFLSIDMSPGDKMPKLYGNISHPALNYQVIGIQQISAETKRQSCYLYFKGICAASGCDIWLSAMMREISIFLGNCLYRPEFLILHVDNTVHTFLNKL